MDESIAAPQHDEHDLAEVAQWLKCKPEDLELVVTSDSISPFLSQIEEMEHSLVHFPEDEARVDEIEHQLREGSETWPVYVEAGDETNFVMEGRHRLVAFHRCGLELVQVCRVSARDRHCDRPAN